MAPLIIVWFGLGLTSKVINSALVAFFPLLVNTMVCLFFFNDTATTEIYTSVNTLSLHDALPISRFERLHKTVRGPCDADTRELRSEEHTSELQSLTDISYAVFCLKKKKKMN